MMKTAVKQASSNPWQQVWGVAVLVAAIVLCWIAYGFYQPRLLEQFGWVGWASWLGIWQGLLGAVVEPLVGQVSDRWMQRYGSRLPQIAVGMTLAGLLFVVIAFLLQTNLASAIAWLIPLLMTVWVMAMIIFRGPAIALIRQLAPTAELPYANALLTFVFGFVGALEPLLVQLFQAMGAVGTFLSGSVILLIAAVCLQRSCPQSSSPPSASPAEFVAVPLKRSLLIFTVGGMAGIESNLALRLLPEQIQPMLPIAPNLLLAAILITSAITAIPLETYVQRLGIRKSMAVSLGAIAILIITSGWISFPITAVCTLLLCGTALGLLFIDQIPFVLTRVPPSRAGLGTGFYFGGMGAATALVGAFQLAGLLPFWWAIVLAIGAWWIAIGCLTTLQRF
jgi:Major Facilitator Superfamily